MGAYARYVEARSVRWYVVALASFALGLMAKAMLVTLPFVLVLFDVWPLERFESWREPSASRAGSQRERGKRRPKQRSSDSASASADTTSLASSLWEKAPFFGLTVVASIITYFVQSSNGAVTGSGALPLGVRVANALVSYVRYLAMTVWPVDLAVFYPYETDVPFENVVGAALGLVVFSTFVLRIARRHPYALVGWLWYVGTLVPVIGFVQAGSQAFADRFTYVPLIGIFVVLAWGVRDLVIRWTIPAPAVGAVAVAVVGAFAVTASAQVAVWRNSETLLTHAARVTRGNFIAHNNLGVSYERQGKIDAAVEEYREALRIKPDYSDARGNLASALRARYEQTVSLHPDDPVAHYGLAASLRDLERSEEAIDQYEHALRLKPDYVDARIGLANVLAAGGRFQDAIEQYEQALRLAPDDARTRFNLGNALAAAGRPADALEQYRRVAHLRPDDAEVWGNLAALHARLHQTEEAAQARSKALELARSQRQWALIRRLEDWEASQTAK